MALQHGTPPEIVTGWIKEVEAQPLNAQRELEVEGETAPLTGAKIRGAGDLTTQGPAARWPRRRRSSARPSTGRSWACGSPTTPTTGRTSSRSDLVDSGACRRGDCNHNYTAGPLVDGDGGLTLKAQPPRYHLRRGATPLPR